MGEERRVLGVIGEDVDSAAELVSRFPAGGWVRLRAAGGLIFRRSELLVFTTGRLVYRRSPSRLEGAVALERTLGEAQIEALRAAVTALATLDPASTPADHGRDTVSYELAVRQGRRTTTWQTAQGIAPPPLADALALLGQLVRFSPDELST